MTKYVVDTSHDYGMYMYKIQRLIAEPTHAQSEPAFSKFGQEMVMEIRIAVAAALAATFSLSAQANCYGTGSFYTCNDSSGNTYNVQRYGNTTQLNGYNAGTGSTWNQTSQTYGNTTYEHGTAANGNQWNGTIQRNGGMTTYTGTDSNGNLYSKTCTAYGCN